MIGGGESGRREKKKKAASQRAVPETVESAGKAWRVPNTCGVYLWDKISSIWSLCCKSGCKKPDYRKYSPMYLDYVLDTWLISPSILY